MKKKNKKKGGKKRDDEVARGSTPHTSTEGQGNQERQPQSIIGLSQSGRLLAGESSHGITVSSSSSGQQQTQTGLKDERQVSEKQKECIPSTSRAEAKKSGDGSNWKPFPDIQKEVVLHQQPLEPGTWALKRIPVSVNHFRMEGIPKIIYMYDVQCALIRVGQQRQGQDEPQQQQPRRVPKDLTESLLKWIVTNLKKESGHQAIASNFCNILYTTKKLEDLGISLQYEYTVTQLKQADIVPRDDAGEQNTSIYKVTFQFANCGDTGGIIDTTPVTNYLAKNGNLKGFTWAPDLRQTLEAAFNAFLRGVPQIRFISVGKSSTIVPWGIEGLGKREGQTLGEGLTAWKGISMNVVMGWKPYLNLEITNTAFVTGTRVLNALMEVLKLRDVGELGDVSKLNKQTLEKARSYLKTIKVQYKVDGNKFTKTVRDVCNFGANHPNTRFDWEGKQVTVFEYFNRRYKANLRFPNGLLLMTSTNAKFPAELCVIKEGQSVNRRLTGKQTDNMMQYARKDPKDHYNDIQRKFDTCNFYKNGMLNQLGVQFPENGMLKFEDARVLVPPTIQYGDLVNQPGQRITPEHGAWKIWGPEKLIFYRNPRKVTKWGVLVVGCSYKFNDGRNYNLLKQFTQLLRDEAGKKGVLIEGDPYEEFDEQCQNFNDAASKNRSFLKEHFSIFKEEGYELVLVVVPGKTDPIYGHVKHAAEIDIGILTQCVQFNNVIAGQRSRSVVQNIILKLNMKLGGINHVVMPPLNAKLEKQFCTLLMDCPVLVLGGDVTHPPPGSKKFWVEGEKEPYSPSYAAVTGSLDKTCMPYMTEVRAQRKAGAGAAEVIQDMEEIVLKMIMCFYHTSGETVLPLKIIYFRDGVGKGQREEVVFEEMPAIRRACARIPEDVVERVLGKGKVYEPPITFITVQKRHKTRIFWHDGKNGIKNPPAGTVNDKDIVDSGFYMNSHEGLLGTSRPCHYDPIWDDSDFSMDEIQSLAYTLCYMFGRCTKSVKMPAPTYYAHLAADRAKKLCEGFETKLGEASIANLNAMLARESSFCQLHPMHFI